MEWHDFRKEQPTNFAKYLCKIKFCGYYYYIIDLWCDDGGHWHWYSLKEIIAWAEIPKTDIR